MKVVFFGTPNFAANVLRSLVNAQYDVVAVVTQPDRPKGRSGKPMPPPVKSVAQELLGVPIYQPEKASDPSFIESLESHQADIFVVVAYGEILRQVVLDLPTTACLNIHASLLPEYRGAAPMQRVLMDGRSESGCCIMHMVRKMDAGDVACVKTVPIGLHTTQPELEAKLCEAGIEGLLEVLAGAAAGQEIVRKPQDETQATFAPKITTEECQIQWTKPARDIHNLIRGVTPKPGAWCLLETESGPKRLKILRSELLEDQHADPGTVIHCDKKRLVLACGEGAVRLIDVQPEGKKAMPVAQFLQGLRGEQPCFA